MFSVFKTFCAEEDGVVTVEWMVIAAAITWMCLGAITYAQSGVNNLARALEQGISVKSTQED
ncbi:hypothetical protein FIU89_10075 [Roseovarius sp. THAF27]|uniref:hypothetical protein n=1 Tax=unclassified Roseovarius TaxID=2614913 RepID=UPI001268AA60|nr:MULTISPECIES: hypothetical protein [unclassified Roseovarius]QFT80956.1 hypothetical protein FIU89_10075 [Roseovarius sp. THAF27]QFT95898.1 hypothetical protein FIU85_01150 [Roseovarius sp. THAF8]